MKIKIKLFTLLIGILILNLPVIANEKNNGIIFIRECSTSVMIAKGQLYMELNIKMKIYTGIRFWKSLPCNWSNDYRCCCMFIQVEVIMI